MALKTAYVIGIKYLSLSILIIGVSSILLKSYLVDNNLSVENINYWDNGFYYGFGLGASGYIKGFRYENTKNIDDYLLHMDLD